MTTQKKPTMSDLLGFGFDMLARSCGLIPDGPGAPPAETKPEVKPEEKKKDSSAIDTEGEEIK